MTAAAVAAELAEELETLADLTPSVHACEGFRCVRCHACNVVAVLRQCGLAANDLPRGGRALGDRLRRLAAAFGEAAQPHACGGADCLGCRPHLASTLLRAHAAQAAELADGSLPTPPAGAAPEAAVRVLFVGRGTGGRVAHTMSATDPTKTLCGSRPAAGKRLRVAAATDRDCLVCARFGAPAGASDVDALALAEGRS